MSGRGAVAVRRTGYPQVDPRAAGLAHGALVVVPPGLPVAAAARVAERRRARLVAARTGAGWGGATRETLARALALRLDEVPVDAVLWDAALVPPATPEVLVRRRLGPDRPFLLVGARRPEGVVFHEPAAPGGLPLSVAPRLERLPPGIRELLRTAGSLGEALGFPVASVGGLVRDLLLERPAPRPDLDLVVEGSAAIVAGRLAGALSGRVVEHPAFLTATVVLPDGRRIDLATARSEAYRVPGALPSVAAASLAEDLARRDFSLNALAVRLEPGVWGRLVDTTGGLADARARRIRVLHPLSFIEDPTRIFRAARLAVRLGCRIDRATRRLAARAAGLDVYQALSGDRLRAELELVLAESRAPAALREAGRLGAWLLLPGGRRSAPRQGPSLAAALAGRGRGALEPATRLALACLALTGGGPAVEAWADRLALRPATREALARARREAPPLLARLARARDPAAAYAILQGVPELTLLWARTLAGHPAARRHLDGHLGRWRRLPALATGDDLVALGVPAGPAVGTLLRRLRALQAAGRVRSRAGALRWLSEAVRRGRGTRTAPLTRPGKGGG